MEKKEEKIVMPGDKLGIIEQYLPGDGTYDDNGDIKSSVLGNVKINQKMKVISVEGTAKPALLKVGDMVYGQITDIKPQRANVKIDCMKDNGRPLALPYMGAIHISQAKKDYLESYASDLEFRGESEYIYTGMLKYCTYKKILSDFRENRASFNAAFQKAKRM